MTRVGKPIVVELSSSSQAGSRQTGFLLPQRFTIAIGTDPALAQAAATRLLRLSPKEIGDRAEELISEALGRTVEAVCRASGSISQEDFYAMLKAEIGERLQVLGLQLVSIKRP